MIRCDPCQGKKKLLMLGNIMKECPYCHGVGYIEDVKKTSTDEIMDLPKPKKKHKKPKVEPILHV